MQVSSSELKTNLGRYLELVDREDIIITRNGRRIARLVREEDNALSDIRSLFGVLASPELSAATDEEIKAMIHEERSKRYDSID